MAESAHQLAVREQLNEQLEALADLDALLQSSEDETGEIQEVDTHAHPSVSPQGQFSCLLCTSLPFLSIRNDEHIHRHNTQHNGRLCNI